MDISSYAFLDVEASGLDPRSYPVEIGWCFSTDGLPGDSFLVRPCEQWVYWSDQAEALHGIPRERLFDEGVPAAEAVERVAALLEAYRVHSDVVPWDAFWLKVLAGGSWPYRSPLLDSIEAFKEGVVHMQPRSAASGMQAYRALVHRSMEVYPHPHRAEADARQQAAILRALVVPEFAEWLRQAPTSPDFDPELVEHI